MIMPFFASPARTSGSLQIVAKRRPLGGPRPPARPAPAGACPAVVGGFVGVIKTAGAVSQHKHIGREIVRKPGALEYRRSAGNAVFQIPSVFVFMSFLFINQLCFGFVGGQIPSQPGAVLWEKDVHYIRQQIKKAAENRVNKTPEKGFGCLCNRPLHSSVKLE